MSHVGWASWLLWGFAATIVLTVGLGIGATTAMFAVIHAVLLSPLPYSDPGRLVRIYTDSPPNRFRFSVALYSGSEHSPVRIYRKYQLYEAALAPNSTSYDHPR